jgi:hypothetical protein
VFAAHGVAAGDVAAAHDFYTAPGGPGYSRKVADAASSVRKALGKHLITKGKVKVLFRDMFLHQCGHTEELAERLGEVMGRMGGPGAGGNPMELLQQLQMAQANEYLVARCGVGAQELMQRAQVLAKASEDEAFLAEVSEGAREREERKERRRGRCDSGVRCFSASSLARPRTHPCLPLSPVLLRAPRAPH